MNKSYWTYMGVVGFVLILISPNFLSQSIFMDGLFYGNLSNNLAEGFGTWWDIKFSETYNLEFHGHPPLQIWLNSILFQVFGNHFWVEKVYSMLTYVCTAYIITKIYKLLFKSSNGWIPLVLWAVMGRVMWAIPNNLLENTLQIFTTAAVYYFLKFILNKKSLSILLGVLMVILATLTKGFVGLFPLAIFFFHFLLNESSGLKTMLLHSITTTVLVLLLFFSLYSLHEGAQIYFNHYWTEQMIGGAVNSKTVESRFFILGKWLIEILPLVLISILSITVIKSKQKIEWKSILLLMCIALSALLPLMLTMKQREFYYLPSLVFIAIAAGRISEPLFLFVKNRISQKFNSSTILIPIVLLVIGMGTSILFYGDYNKNEAMISFSEDINDFVPKNSTVLLSHKVRSEYSMISYLYRRAKVSIKSSTKFRNSLDYYVARSSEEVNDEKYQKLELRNEDYALYVKRPGVHFP